MGLGGGVSGKVDFPDHMKQFHYEFLSNTSTPSISSGNDMVSLLDSAITASSPYFGEAAYDPDTALSDIETRLATWVASTDGLNPYSSWDSAIDNAVVKANDTTVYPRVDLTDTMDTDALANIGNQLDNLIDTSTIVQDGSTNFENRTIARHQRTVARFASGMADINAVMSSAFVWGIGLLENDRQQELSEYDFRIEDQARIDLAKIGAQAQLNAATNRLNNRDRLVERGTTEAVELNKFKISQQGATSELQYRTSLAKITSKVEQAMRDIELDYLDATYDFTLFQYGGNFLASINGAPTVPQSPSKFQSIVGGALGGVSAGASVGGPIGAGVGGIVGTLLNI